MEERPANASPSALPALDEAHEVVDIGLDQGQGALVPVSDPRGAAERGLGLGLGQVGRGVRPVVVAVGGGFQFDLMFSLARSATISVNAQNTGGEATQPIGRARKNSTMGSCPGGVGRTMPKCFDPSGLTFTL